MCIMQIKSSDIVIAIVICIYWKFGIGLIFISKLELCKMLTFEWK